MTSPKQYLNSSLVSEQFKEIIRSMDETNLHDAFYKELEFGTAGLRGILGPGPNRMNEFVVKRATYGFGKFLLEKFQGQKKSVVIASDNRHESRNFVLACVDTLNLMGIDTFIFDDLRPTPLLSFAVRATHSVGGIMITASHNPKEYNGYKVYDENGCQLVPNKIKRLVSIIAELPSELDLIVEPALIKGINTVFDSSIDEDYIAHVLTVGLRKDLNKDKIKIVYSPLHGTSLTIAKNLFPTLGYKNIYYVKSQCTFDPDFSNTLSPNPEEKEAYIEALKLAKEEQADLIMLTDPDADRVGIAFLDSKGQYKLLTGNETGALLIDYILKTKTEFNDVPKNPIIFNTIVTSTLGTKIAANYGVKVESVLTGFKFIGDKIEQYNNSHEYSFVFGYEESYGYLIKDFARDKDSLQALLIISEMTNYYLLNGKRLDEVYRQLEENYGYHKNTLYNVYFKGEEGLKTMDTFMNNLRINKLITLGGKKVSVVEDYLNSMAEGEKKYKLNLPKSNVLKYLFEDGSWLAIRPSGTEPKCKFYYEIIGKSDKEIASLSQEMQNELVKKYM